MEEKRKISRVSYPTRGVIVDVETGEKYYVETENASPLGMGIHMGEDAPDLAGRDVIIVACTLIMYAEVTRQEKREDGSYTVGIKAKEFTPDVLQYLFDSIGK